MNRHYYISDNLDELERLEAELEASGIATEQIHVLSEKDAETGQRHLHEVSPFMKKDVVRSGRVGLLVGLVLAIVAVAFAYASGWTETAAGWIPVIFLGAVLCAFCLWEGSFFGLQRTNRAFRPFEERLHQGQHLFFVDVKNAQEPILVNVVSHHPRLQDAGTGPAVSPLLLAWQQRWRRFRRMV
ncbi:magnesium transporter [Pseudomonas aeruginosa]|uniref:magnesium transporter n=1 Tax=Pseudomonas aeruginosa TaxID=287 RepID=UPI0008779A66|nr:magnesium transporter [Pseudomonas aeruginosa]